MLIRFCPEPYLPFNLKIIDKYVVSETHKPFWEIPSLAKLTEKLNFSAIDSFNYYLEKNGHDLQAFWEQVDDAIISIVKLKQFLISRHADLFRRKHLDSQIEFFELLRFDFLVDEELNLHLIEVG